MEINRLNQEELTYELTVRGLPVGKVDDMRAGLRAALKLEKGGRALLMDPYPIEFASDLEALNKKLEEVKGLLGF